MIYNNYACLGCAPGFQLVEEQISFSYFRLVAAPTRYKSFFSNSAYCKPSSNPCLEFVTENYAQSDHCKVCAPGHYLTPQGQCVRLLTPVRLCLLHEADGSCHTCEEKTIPHDGRCVEPVPEI